MAKSLTLVANVSDAFLQSSSTVYATALTGGTITLTNGTAGSADQDFTNPQFKVREYLLAFDTSTLDFVPTSAILSACPSLSNGTFFPDVEAYAYDWGATVATGDWIDPTTLTTRLAYLSSAGFLQGGPRQSFTTEALVAHIANASDGWTRLVLISSSSRLAVAPSGNLDLITFASANSTDPTRLPELTLSIRAAFVTSDRIKETTTTTGTGNIALAGAVSGFRAFSAAAIDSDQVEYAIVGSTEWEVGVGTWLAGNILKRDHVLTSSNAGALVSFSAGTKDVYNTFAAQQGTLAMASQIQTAYSLLPNNAGALVVESLELDVLELGANAVLEVS